MEKEEKAATKKGKDDSPHDADRTKEENERKRRPSLSMLRLVTQVRGSSSKALRRSSIGAPLVDNGFAPPPQHLQSTHAAPAGERRCGEADDEPRWPDGETKKKGGRGEPEPPISRRR